MQLELLPGCEYPQAIGALFAEYTDMLVREDPAFASYLELQHYEQEVAHLEQKYGPPGGMLYLARADGQDAGCIGLRRMDASRCEMKRLPDGMPEVKATSLGYHGALLGAAALVLKVQQTERGG